VVSKIKLSDFSEETRYVVECPSCGDYLETPDDPENSGEIFYDGCSTLFKIEAD